MSQQVTQRLTNCQGFFKFSNHAGSNPRSHQSLTDGVAPFSYCPDEGDKVVRVSVLGQAGTGSTLYLAAKAGIIGLTRSLAAEVGPSGINVNAIVPGLGDTGLYSELGGLAPMIKEFFASNAPMRKLTTPQDIGNTVVFLVSDAANDITGQTIQVDSGDTMV